MSTIRHLLPIVLISSLSTHPALALDDAPTLLDAVKQGTVNLNLNLRYETVNQDNAQKNADALTLRSRLGYTTAGYRGFSAMAEFEDSRSVLGVDDYNDTLGSQPDYSVVADPETTELDQAFLQYQNAALKARLGRQVVALDNQRFIGHVGWRQDRQTFDAFSLSYTPISDLTLFYAWLDQRNRLFAEARDINSSDHLLNAAYKTPFGKISAYTYLLEDEDTKATLDTLGLRFTGSRALEEIELLYTLEFARQDAERGSSESEADYYLIEGGVTRSGIAARIGYEVLGSDEGNFGFSTPLGTVHAFNGWADQFLATPASGLEDLYMAVSGPLAGGKWSLIYHDFSADEATNAVDDLGSEIDAVYSRKFSDHFTAGIKYAAYSAGDTAAGKVDTDKLWLFVSADL